MVGVLLFGHVWALSKGRTAFSLSVFVLEILFLWFLTRPLRMFAQRVTTSTSGIEVVFYVGLHTRLAWDDIRQVRDFSGPTTEGRMRFDQLFISHKPCRTKSRTSLGSSGSGSYELMRYAIQKGLDRLKE